MTELPLLVIDVQRGGPSTGLPTKTEQADLLQAMYGRNGEAPVPIVAPQSPGDCFSAAVEAARIAITYRTPVMLLSDGYLANGSEPWLIPVGRRPAGHRPRLRDRAQPRPRRHWPDGGPRASRTSSGPTSATRRRWPARGRSPAPPGLEHRIGGLEKGEGHGNISYDPANHDLMVRTRQAKIEAIAKSLPPLEVDDPSPAQAQGARDRLGLDVRPDRRRLPPRPPRRLPRRADPPAPPQPVPDRPRRDPRGATTRCSCRR